MNAKYLKFIEYGGFSIVLFTLIYLGYIQGYFNLENIQNIIVEQGKIGYFIYFLFFIILSLLGISVTPLILLGGILFSYKTGFILAFSGLFTASTLAFFISKFISHNIIEKKHPTYHYKFKIIKTIIDKLSLTIEKNPFKTIFFTKFVIANIPVSYALGLISSKFKNSTFILATFLNNIIFSFLLIFFGASVIKNPLLILGVVCFLILYYIIKNKIKHKYISISRV